MSLVSKFDSYTPKLRHSIELKHKIQQVCLHNCWTSHLRSIRKIKKKCKKKNSYCPIMSMKKNPRVTLKGFQHMLVSTSTKFDMI